MTHPPTHRIVFVATVLAVTAVTWSAAPAAGQPPGAAPPGQHAAAGALTLTLEDAIARAVRASHRIGEGQARQEAATAVVGLSAAADMPIVSALAGYTRTNHIVPFGLPPQNPTAIIYPDIPDNWRTRLDLQWPVYTFGRFEAMERAARREAAAAGQDVTTLTADVRFDATRAFWALVTAKESVRVVEEALALIESHLRDVRNMRAVGLLAPNDELSVEARVSRQRVQLIEARNMQDVAAADLRRVTGLEPGVAITVDAVLEGAGASVAPYEQLLADARASRPERQALQARVDALGERRTATADQQRPTLAVTGGFDYARPNPRIFPREDEWHTSWDVGVNLIWPFWDGGRTKAQVAEVTANQRAIEQRLAEFDTMLDFEVKQRLLDVQSARESIGASADEVRAATEARRVVAERFKAGLVTNTEVLDAQQAMLLSQFDRTRALATARLAEARLDRAVGR
jgi:outer membrane protein